MGQPNSGSLDNKFDNGGMGYETLPGTLIELAIPAHLGVLPVLGAAVREYCAALPKVFASETTTNTPVHRAEQARMLRNRFGTGPLQLPGTASVTIIAGYSHFVYSAELVLQEATTNIVRHGYGHSKLDQTITLELSAAKIWDQNLQMMRRAFVMELVDNAIPYDLTKATTREPDPLEPRESGYGIFLIRKLTDGVGYHYETGRNHLQLIKYVETIQK